MKILKSIDPHYLVHRLATDQIVGVLADRDLGELAGADMLLADGEVDPGAEPMAHAEVRLRKGVRFATGEAAVTKLGDKLDPYMARTFAASNDPVWFHPLSMVNEWEESAVVKGLEVQTRIQKSDVLAPDEAAVADMTSADLGAVARLLNANPDVEGAEALALIVKSEYDRRGLDVDESLHIFKGLWGYPAGKSALAKRLVEMMPAHKVYVEPFVGSGAVLFAKEKAPVEVVNDSDEEVAEAWKILSKLSESDLKRLQSMNWTGDRDTFMRMKKQTGGDDVVKLHRFFYLSKFAYGRWRGTAFSPDMQGREITMPRMLEKNAPRVKGVVAIHGDYEDVCRKYDGPDTLHFLDPPYVGYSSAVGERNFDEDRFFEMLTQLEGKVIVTYGVKGKLPKMLRGAGYNVDKVTTNRAIRWSVASTNPSAALDQLIAYNYDPKNPAENTEKAEWSTEYKNDLPDSSFLYIAPGGEKDEEGKTVPRTLRHFPMRDADGKIDEPHARNAIARIPQSNAEGLDSAAKERLQAEARSLLEEAKKKLSNPQAVEKEGRSKVLCLYHADLDGVASAAVVLKSHPDAELVSINYGQEFDWDSIKDRETVFMVDYGMQPFDGMVRLKDELEKQGSRFIWIDHHVTAIEAAEKEGFEADGIRKVGEAGCELTWKFLNPDTPMPDVVRLAGRFDVWDHTDPIVLPVHYAMEATAEANDPTSSWWKEWFEKGEGEFGGLVEQGKAIGGWLKEFSAESIRLASFDVEFAGHKCVAACTSLPGSMQFESVADGKDAAIAFCFSPHSQWNVSMYALKEGVDVGAVCAANGGGGHAGAGGFQAKELPFDLPVVAEKAVGAIDPTAALQAAAASKDNTFGGVNELLDGFATAQALSAGIGVGPKWNGRLAVLQAAGGKATIAVAGAEGDQSGAMPGIASDMAKLGDGAALVGEVVEADIGVVFMARDVLVWDGKNCAEEPWADRQKVLNQALPSATSAIAPSPSRLVYSEDKLKAAIKWASEIPGAVGVQVFAGDAKAGDGAVAEVTTPRIINALVVGVDESDEGAQSFRCAVGPLSESESGRAKDVVEVGGRKYTPVGSTSPTNVAASEGDVLRLEVGEILVIDSDDSAAIGWDTSKVLERVHVKPATVSEIRALARPHEIQKICKILKRDSERHYVLSVVLEPNDGEDGAPLDPDAHREIYSEDEVWDACVYWYEQGSSLGVMHQRESSKAEMLPVHNFIAPVDMEIDGEAVRAGSWLIGSLVLSAALWQQIDAGELNAWSVDGRGLRRPEAIAS